MFKLIWTIQGREERELEVVEEAARQRQTRKNPNKFMRWNKPIYIYFILKNVRNDMT